MEIEKKYLVSRLPEGWENCPFHEIEQAYLCRKPVIRVRKKDDRYILTVKGKGKMAREEFELPLEEEEYRKLLSKAEGSMIRKKRVLIPLPPYRAELDFFQEPFDDLIMAEVEFPTVEEALAFTPPEWFGEEVTEDRRFHNARMSTGEYPEHSFWKANGE